MIVSLIPVLEIGYTNQGVEAPTKYPYWENGSLWDAYHAVCYAAAGFEDQFLPYQPGASLYQLPAITASNLTKLIKDQTAELRAGTSVREEACGFFGGYILRIDEQAVYFPQCCRQLSDIVYWERLAAGAASYYEGHPVPSLSFTKDTVLPGFVRGKVDESFQPIPPVLSMEISRPALQLAVAQANWALTYFAQRLRELSAIKRLGVPAIDAPLIWEDGRHE